MKERHFINMLAYIAIGLIAVALVLSSKMFSWLINANIAKTMTLIAECIAYSITAVFGFYFARSKRNIGWTVAYIIFLVLIIVAVILSFTAIFA